MRLSQQKKKAGHHFSFSLALCNPLPVVHYLKRESGYGYIYRMKYFKLILRFLIYIFCFFIIGLSFSDKAFKITSLNIEKA